LNEQREGNVWVAPVNTPDTGEQGEAFGKANAPAQLSLAGAEAVPKTQISNVPHPAGLVPAP